LVASEAEHGARAHIIGSRWVQTPRHGDPIRPLTCRRIRQSDVRPAGPQGAEAPEELAAPIIMIRTEDEVNRNVGESQSLLRF
jgi:hypothetical protein